MKAISSVTKFLVVAGALLASAFASSIASAGDLRLASHGSPETSANVKAKAEAELEAQGLLGTMRLALGNNSKEMCTCLFVLGRTDEECREYVRLAELNAKIVANTAAKSVTASYLFVFAKTADFDSRLGCRLR